MRILLYTRRGCHLCEEAEDMLAAAGVPAAHLDVDAVPEAAARYGLRVPVLEIDGEAVLEGRFQEGSLAALVAARGGLTSPGECRDRPTGRREAPPT